METQKEGTLGFMSVPAFGDWEHSKGGVVPDYSVDFTKIRESRRQSKSRVSLGNDEDFASPRDNSTSEKSSAVGGGDTVVQDAHRPILASHPENRSPTRLRKIMSYLNCCGRLEA